MQIVQNRRSFLGGLSASGATSLFGGVSFAAEAPPETPIVRLAAVPGACTAPLYLAEELLHEEGFAEVRYVPSTGPSMVSEDKVDFDMLAAVDYLPLIDAGMPLIVLSGVHVGCFELRANESIQVVSDLRGKRVAVSTPLGISADHLLVSAMAAYVGLDPVTEIEWVTNPSLSQVELFDAGRVDAFIGFPPDPQQSCARSTGHPVVNMANDKPWSNYFCCMAIANTEFVRNNPVATKRALRAIMRATDICHKQPELAAQRMVDVGFSQDCALMTLNDARYDLWRDYDPEDTVRFFSLLLHQLAMIRKTPNEIISEFTDWRFLEEVKRELA
ncbi:MAG: NitT/TauT family transport system substrate-binding protein [Alphaproteobacteria bacterium]|jgi:NitT/TauT family transport system substrate-binding protein|nr:NitT/TauT family transport system substrate-binding protein [Alphaproteobacteria bacterium]